LKDSADRRVNRALSRAEYVVDFLPKVKIEVVVPNGQLGADRRHREVARTGRSAMARSSSRRSSTCAIRTGETNEARLAGNLKVVALPA